MKSILLSIILLVIMSINTYGEDNQSINILDHNNTLPQPVKIKTVRGILGENNPLEHTRGQLRAGYITFKEDGNERNSAYALGGHYHFDSKRWNGLSVGLSAYSVVDLSIKQNPNNVNEDFFNARGKSFILLTEAYLDGKWGNTEIKLGRQILNTPHADSDDLRMIPNYFEAYTITNTDINDLTLSAGYIRRMAGWENGIDASKFVKISKTLESTEDTDGIYYANASYEGIKDLSLSFWYYNYQDIANVIYAEVGYNYAFTKYRNLTFGLQYNGSRETGAAYLGKQDAHTFGASVEFAAEDIGIHILAAYNRDNGTTGATELSLGGGPFFTSMEVQTLDAIGMAGSAWMIGAGFHLEKIGINGLHAGIAYGNFKAEDHFNYNAKEIDAVIDYAFNEKLSLTAAYASVSFDMGRNEKGTPLIDQEQFRLIVNYNF